MSKRVGIFALACTAACLTLGSGVLQAHPQASAASGAAAKQRLPVRSMIAGRIDEQTLVTLHGNTRSEARPENDRGRVDDGMVLDHLLLVLQRPPEVEAAFQQTIAELHSKKSPLYHKWLTPQQIGEQFGPSQADLETIRGWLESHGFTVNVTYPSGMLIDFSGTAGKVRSTFNTEIHHLSVNGRDHIANMSDPRIPAALAGSVLGVASLNDFRPRQMNRLAKPAKGAQFTFGPSCGFLTSLRDSTTNCEALMPQDLATIYSFNPAFAAGYTGKGQTVVVIEDEDMYSAADWAYFRKVGGLTRPYPYGSLSQTHPAPSSGTNNCTDPGDLNDTTDDEVAIDMEWASAAAPNAAIQVAVCADTRTTFGGLIALQNLLSYSNPPAIVSISYGESESENGAAQNAAYNSTYQQGVAEGVSIFVSSGDEGPASSNANGADSTRGITVSGFTSTPYNISVGGTDFGDAVQGTESTYWKPGNTAFFGSAMSYIPEIPWNDSCADPLIIGFLGTYYNTALSNGYGPSGTGTCNTYPFNTTSVLLTTGSGSGGPSNCATGAPTTNGAPASGGTCAGYAKPSWQSIFGNPSDGVRDIPDVSLMAANGLWNHFYMICMTNPKEVSEGVAVASCTEPPQDWPGFGGTSVSSPIWAGIQALINQASGERWGQVNTVYYALASAEYGPSGNPGCNSSLGPAATGCVFYDVTQGSIELPCASLGTGTAARLYNCYRPSATDSATDIGVTSSAPMAAFPGLGGPGPVTNLNVTAGGSGYTGSPGCALTGDAGSGATCSVSTSGLVTSPLTKTANGSGYTTAAPPSCFLVGGGGTGATCSASVNSSGTITLTLRNGGQGYTSAPACLLLGGSGSGATCSASISMGVTGITLTAGGSGYTSDPTCTITDGGGSGATCAAIINGVTAFTPAYPATTGWDFATGIGTVNVYNLISAWTAPE